MSTTSTLPTLAAADAERLSRETAAYLALVDAFRAEGVEPRWGTDTPATDRDSAGAARDGGCAGASTGELPLA